jgi:hypothetical protein
LRDHASEFTAKGANLAAVGLGDVRYAEEFRKENGIEFPLLIDERKQAYAAIDLRSGNVFHLLRGDNFAARHRAKAAGASQRRLGRDPFQLGGSFVLGPGNVDRFTHVSKTFGDNAPISALLAALEGLP